MFCLRCTTSVSMGDYSRTVSYNSFACFLLCMAFVSRVLDCLISFSITGPIRGYGFYSFVILHTNIFQFRGALSAVN